MSRAPLTWSPRALAHRAAQVAVDVGLVTAAYWLSFYFRFDGDVPGRYERLFAGTIAIVIGVKLVVFVGMRFYTKWWRFTSLRDLQAILVATAGSSLILAALRVIRSEGPALFERVTAMPVVPDGSRHATININGIEGGQPADGEPSPCVADRCRVVFDRRFLLEEGLEPTRAEIVALVRKAQARMPAVRFSIEDRLIFEPTRAPEDAPVIGALTGAIRQVTGRTAALVASPGTYDQKHVARIGHIYDCIAYGPGILDLAHRPDEWVGIQDMVESAKVMAIGLDLLLNGRSG